MSGYEMSVPKDSEEHEIAGRLFSEAEAFWAKQHIKQAVVWVEHQDGGFVLFTRGEHAEDIKEFVRDIQ